MSEKILKFAKMYKKMGLSVIPLHPNTKIPLIPWKPYRKKIADDTQILEWFDNDDNQNIGIVTGEISSIAVIDYDDADVYNPDLTPTVSTPKGYHCYYNWYEGITNASLGQKTQPIDIRGEGGFVVAPPSIVDGKQYKWLKGKTPKIPLKDIPSGLIKPPKIQNHCPTEVNNGDRNNSLFRFCCVEVKQNPYKKYYEKVLNWNMKLDDPLEVDEVERTIDNVYENHKSYILDQLKNLMY